MWTFQHAETTTATSERLWRLYQNPTAWPVGGPRTKFRMVEVTEPASPSESPGFLLWRVTLAWQRAMAAVLREHDLTHVQFVLLANVWWLGDGPTQRRLAEHAGTDPMMTSQVLRTLEGKGLVVRVVDAADSRARRVTLTEQGEAVVGRTLPDVEATDASFFAGVPEALSVLSRLGGQPLGEPGE